VRSNMPDFLKRRYAGIEGLRIIEKVIPWEELEREYQKADIFVFPGHVSPWSVFLEPMSYELPLVATGVYDVPEKVDDGRTGLLI